MWVSSVQVVPVVERLNVSCTLGPPGYQLLYALGLVNDVPDPLHVHAWLDMHQGERFGLVLAHAQELLEGPADEQSGFLDLLERLLQV